MNQNPKNHVTLSHFTSISLQTAAIYIYALPNRTYFQNPFQMWPRRIIDKKGPSIEQSRGHTEQWIRISSQRAEKGSNQEISSTAGVRVVETPAQLVSISAMDQ